jgi:hypothetical protein
MSLLVPICTRSPVASSAVSAIDHSYSGFSTPMWRFVAPTPPTSRPERGKGMNVHQRAQCARLAFAVLGSPFSTDFGLACLMYGQLLLRPHLRGTSIHGPAEALKKITSEAYSSSLSKTQLENLVQLMKNGEQIGV